MPNNRRNRLSQANDQTVLELETANVELEIKNQSQTLEPELEISERNNARDGITTTGKQSRTDNRQSGEDRKPKIESQKTIAHTEINNHKSVVRVSLEKLDDLVRIMSGLVVSRSVFEQRLGELEQQIGELNNSTRRLRQSTNKIETDFEADMLSGGSQQLAIASGQFGNPKSQILNAKSFDSLELDRYTEFHQTMRDLIETTVDTSAINSELDSLKGNLEMLFESQRQLIEEMQDKLLRLRMVTFGTLSIRLQRTVRVTGDDQGKSAELTIEGENLEVDTQILDALVEPLLHLLRNAVAHGIESPETRRLLGKPEAGRINLRVHDEGTHFILTVSDDGRGISAASLKAKAVQHGIISEERAEKMSEQEAFALIFHAGTDYRRRNQPGFRARRRNEYRQKRRRAAAGHDFD
jgi:chemosensory pili system protein ChpA (sensor histidine kinase/response regulator)